MHVSPIALNGPETTVAYIVYYSYNEAMATIRRVPGFDHHFNLVITRVFEDGDQELL